MSKILILLIFLLPALSACVDNKTGASQPAPTQENFSRLTEASAIVLTPSKTPPPIATLPGEGAEDKCVDLKLTSAECSNLGTHNYSSALTAAGNCGWKNLNLTVKNITDFSENSVFMNAYEMKKTSTNTYSYSLVNSAGTLEAGTITFTETGFIYDQRIETKSGLCTIHGEYTLMDSGG